MAYQSKHTGANIDAGIDINTTQNSRLTALESKDTTQDNRLTDLESTDSNLTNQITTLTNQIATLTSQITTLQNELATKNFQYVTTNQLLWSSTATSFAAQTVSLDLTPYSFIIITYQFGNSNAEWFCDWLPVIDGKVYRLVITARDSSNNGCRYVTVKNTGLTFAAGYYTGSSNNNYVLPRNVYGVK